MVMFTVLANLAVSVAMYVASLAFLFWLWRRYKLQSAFWLFIYVALGTVWLGLAHAIVRLGLTDAIVRHTLTTVAAQATRFNWPLGQLTAWLTHFHKLMNTLAFCAVVLLVAADVVFLLESRSERPLPGLVAWLPKVRPRAGTLGTVMILCRLAPAAVLLVLCLKLYA